MQRGKCKENGEWNRLKIGIRKKREEKEEKRDEKLNKRKMVEIEVRVGNG